MIDSIPYVILVIHFSIIADLIIDWSEKQMSYLEGKVSNKLNNAYVRSFQ